MRKVWLATVVLGLLALTPAAFTQSTPPPNDAATICHQCEWIKIQISDIDEKIASWQRQIRTIHKISNLSDPNIQNALKDIDNTIAGLKANKADLEAKLAECIKRCAEAQRSSPKPVTPPSGGGTPGGGSANRGGVTTGGSGEATGGTGADNGASGNNPPPTTECPNTTGPSTVAPGAGTTRPPSLLPSSDIPPAPTTLVAKDDWVHLLRHMGQAEDWWTGDEEDVWDVYDDIMDAIRDAYWSIQDNPDDEDAWARLHWLRQQQDYYGHWKAWIEDDDKSPDPKNIHLFRQCSPLYQKMPRALRENDSGRGSDNPLGGLSIGIDVGGGQGDDRRGAGGGQHGTGQSTTPGGRTTPTTPSSSEPHTH